MPKTLILTLIISSFVLGLVGMFVPRSSSPSQGVTIGAAYKSQEINGFRVISKPVYVGEIKAYVTEIEVDGRSLFYVRDINNYSTLVIERNKP